MSNKTDELWCEVRDIAQQLRDNAAANRDLCCALESENAVLKTKLAAAKWVVEAARTVLCYFITHQVGAENIAPLRALDRAVASWDAEHAPRDS